MIGHLGTRVSALLDGQLSPADTERAWSHVHTCHVCRDQVEREGWIKTQLAGLTFADCHRAPDGLKGMLRGPELGSAPSECLLGVSHPSHAPRARRPVGVVAMSGGALGAAVFGVLAFGVGPASAPPSVERRAPVTSVVNYPSPAVATPIRGESAP